MSARRDVQPIAAVSLVGQVTSRVRQMIVTGELGPGDHLSISELAADLQISHIPVREALRTLESEGLLEIRPGRGAWVAALGESDIRNIYRLRLWIEPELAALSAPLFAAEDLAALERHLEEVVEGEDIDTQLDRHRQFHLTLLAPAASEWDLRVLGKLWSAGERYGRLLFQKGFKQDQGVHRPLINAARSKSPERLAQAVRKHLADNERALLRLMAEAAANKAAV